MSNPVIRVFLGWCQWFLCKRSLMKLIQCHAWTVGYHTPSCPTNPFNLSLSHCQSCEPVSLAAVFHFLLQHWERFKVNLVGKSCTESLYASTMLSPLFYFNFASSLLPVSWTHTHLHKKDRSGHKGLCSLAATYEYLDCLVLLKWIFSSLSLRSLGTSKLLMFGFKQVVRHKKQIVILKHIFQD